MTVRVRASYVCTVTAPLSFMVSVSVCKLRRFAGSERVAERLTVTTRANPTAGDRTVDVATGTIMPHLGSGPYRTVDMPPSG